SDHALCEIFDPVTNRWTRGPDMLEQVFDSPAALLPDGRVIDLTPVSTHTYLFATTWALGTDYDNNKLRNEGLSVLLSDGSVLFGTLVSGRYFYARDVGVEAGGAQTYPATDEFGFGHWDGEIGAALQLYDGRVMVMGGNQENGLYTPPTMN